MMTVAKLLATCGGIGYIKKGAGSLAALFLCIIWMILHVDAWSILFQLLFIALLFIAGVWSANLVEKEWGHDSNRVVLDEVMGMALSLFMLPHSWITLVIAFVLFRFFDISKIFFIRKMENFKGGWGVMLDDGLAGVYTLLLLQMATYFQFLPKA